MEPEHKHNNHGKNPWRLLSTFSIFIIIGVIGYYLITEHRAHVAGFFASFPWWILIFLLCPLMHFMHGKHGGHGDHHGKDEEHDNNSSEKKD